MSDDRGAAGEAGFLGTPPRPLFRPIAMNIAVSAHARVGNISRTAVRRRLNSPAPRAFTLIEALVAISLAAIAGSALLLGTSASLQTTDEVLRQTIANGMAQQLMDEVVGGRYMDVGVGAYQTTLGPSPTEAAGVRYYYNDIDDFNGLRSCPPTDPFGVPLGTEDGLGNQRESAFQCRSGFFRNWRQEISVYYVNDANPTVRLPAGQTSDYRVVEVRIIYVDPDRGDRELAKIRRVVAYVPQLQIN